MILGGRLRGGRLRGGRLRGGRLREVGVWGNASIEVSFWGIGVWGGTLV
jgi:hypothetical protein